MPRKGKGGRVEGVDQTAYSNRSDLNNRGPQPITAAPGEPYGQRKMLEDAQRAVPMGGTPSPPAVATPTPSNTTPLNNAMTTAAQPPSNPEPGGFVFFLEQDFEFLILRNTKLRIFLFCSEREEWFDHSVFPS